MGLLKKFSWLIVGAIALAIFLVYRLGLPSEQEFGSQAPEQEDLPASILPSDVGVTYNLHLTVEGEGTVSESGGDYVAGTTLQILATASEGYTFSHWEVAPPIKESGNPVSIPLNRNRSAIAVFAEGNGLATNIKGVGTIKREKAGPGYESTETVNLTAAPGTGWIFDHWEGDVSGEQRTTSLLMDASKTVTAVFTSGPRLAVREEGHGKVLLDPPGGDYEEGKIVTLTAVSTHVGEFFESWVGDIIGDRTSATAKVRMDSSKTVTARFTKSPANTVRFFDDGVGQFLTACLVKHVEIEGFPNGGWAVVSETDRKRFRATCMSTNHFPLGAYPDMTQGPNRGGMILSYPAEATTVYYNLPETYTYTDLSGTTALSRFKFWMIGNDDIYS